MLFHTKIERYKTSERRISQIAEGEGNVKHWDQVKDCCVWRTCMERSLLYTLSSSSICLSSAMSRAALSSSLVSSSAVSCNEMGRSWLCIPILLHSDWKAGSTPQVQILNGVLRCCDAEIYCACMNPRSKNKGGCDHRRG